MKITQTSVTVRGLVVGYSDDNEGVRAAAERLHGGMRNYGSVENDRKALLVSAILLALWDRPRVTNTATLCYAILDR